jgi:hypothetical protein
MKMRKIIDGALIALCVLTLVDTDFSHVTALNIAVFICMGIALISSAALRVKKKRK